MIRLLRLDAVQLLRDRLASGILCASLVASFVAAIAGYGWSQRLERDIALIAQTAAETRAEDRVAWSRADTLEPAAAAVLPTRLVTTLILGAPVLPDFTVGRSAIEPNAAAVRSATRPDAMFTRYQVENPERLARGALDMAFVAVVIAPLLLIGLGYGVFVADRESGTAGLWLAQAGSPIKLIAIRSITRLSLVFIPILATALLLLALGGSDRAAAVAGWLGIALLGLLFWWAIILLVNSFAIAAETAALSLVGLWALLVFVAPVAIGSIVQIVNPPPSRFEQIAVARAAEIGASRSYDDDHPELASPNLEGRRASVRKSIEVRRAIASATAPLRAADARQMAAQRSLGERLSLAAPPVLIANALAAIARTDDRFYASQRAAAGAHLEPLGQALADAALGAQPIDVTSFDRLPVFKAPTAPPLDPYPLFWVAALTLGIGTLALLRLRRARPL